MQSCDCFPGMFERLFVSKAIVVVRSEYEQQVKFQVLNKLFEMFFFRGGMIAQHTSFVTIIKQKLGCTNLNLIWIFSNSHRVRIQVQKYTNLPPLIFS